MLKSKSWVNGAYSGVCCGADHGWEIVEDIVDVVVFVELWVGGLTSNSSVLRVVSWCA